MHMVLRRFLRLFAFLCVAFLMACDAGAGETVFRSREDRLEAARLVYNEETVNIYTKGRGKKVSGKFNIQYYIDRKKNPSFLIPDSLQITDEAEMTAILEVLAGSEYYDPELFGPVSFMTAEWIAHNLAFSMATGSEEEKNMVQTFFGKDLRMFIKRAKELDLSTVSSMPESEQMVYHLIETVYGLNSSP